MVVSSRFVSCQPGDQIWRFALELWMSTELAQESKFTRQNSKWKYWRKCTCASSACLPRDFCVSPWQLDIARKTRETHGKIVPETWEVWFWIMSNIPSCYGTDKKGNITSIRKMTAKNNESRVPLQVKCPCIRIVIFGICISLFLRLNSDTKYRFACSVWSNNQC